MDMLAKIFWAAAIGGSVLFVLRFLMMIMGMSHDDHQVASDGDHDGHFKLLTVHSLTGFAMMFGWVGLACLKHAAIGPELSCVAAIAAGGAMMAITAVMFKMAAKLTSKGADFDIRDLVGLEGTVYTAIPEGSTGKVHISAHGVIHELLAVSRDKSKIESFKRIQVVGVLDDQTVVVK